MSPATTPQKPLLVRTAKAEVFAGDPGGTITLLADATATDGALNSNRSTFRDGFDGAPPHFHKVSGELFFVLDGSLQVLLGEAVEILDKGDVLFVPPGVPHAFAAAPGSDADVLFVFTPGVPRAEYFGLLDRAHTGEASWQEIADSQERFDNYYVDSAAWTQARPASSGS